MNHDHCHCGCHGEHEHTVVPSLSDRETEVLQCPHCHQEMSVELVSVLHPGDKELKELFAGTLNRPTCPKCGTPMVLRTRRSDGGTFWGCPNYPSCRGIRNT